MIKKISIFLLIFISFKSSAGVINFEDINVIPGDYFSRHFGTITSGDFDFYAKPYLGSVVSDEICTTQICSSNGTQWLSASAYQGVGLSMTRTDGALFSISSFEMAEAWSTQSVPTVLDVIGYYYDGSSLSQSIAFDRIYDAIGPIKDFQFVSLEGNWNNLLRVEFIPQFGTFGIDNISYTVDEPPSLILMIFTLIMLSIQRMCSGRCLSARWPKRRNRCSPRHCYPFSR